ncbi:C40 family peptidase [Streptomyces sp. H27-D2]|uniref:C40 family peptidase n=1 Tax=Streptomyces sp. H27-D2 TaxID=3046304 RepID=UPI002DBEC2F1|nr:NlpC/P60 family protein [Streptomyces sp. H27-D2]MEC4015694.1 NlpC/P60 family protein [Streptomyces sp. H27-D2]
MDGRTAVLRAGAVACTAVLCGAGLLAGASGAYAQSAEPGPKGTGAAGSEGSASPEGSGEAVGSEGSRPEPPKVKPELEKVHKEVERLYRKAEAATDAYNAANENVVEQQKSIVKLAKAIAKAQGKLDTLSKQAGAMARAQYQGAGMPPEAQLMLNGDPQAFFEDAGLVHKGQRATKGMIGQLSRTKKELSGYAKDASSRWEKLEKTRESKAGAKKEIKQKIKAAEKLESRLQAKERARLKQLEAAKAQNSQAKWLSSGVLDEIDGKASAQGKRAIAFATKQIGKQYEWGAEGPSTFDCSGLTLKAWAAAGRSIPRTSQEQWKQLPRVPLEAMRPGDLIIYHDDASHVGMYLGDGAIVHAPRPGRQITMTGAGSMTILGVVRPDK